MINSLFDNTITGELIVVYSLIGVVLILIVAILYLDKREKRKKDLFNNKFINTVKMKAVSLDDTDSSNLSKKPVEKSVKVFESSNSYENDELSEMPVKKTEEIKKQKEIFTNSFKHNLEKTKIVANSDNLYGDIEEKRIIKEDSTLNDDLLDIQKQNNVEIVGVSDLTKELAIKAELLKRASGIVKEETVLDDKNYDEEIEEELSKTQAQISLEELHKELEKAVALEKNNIDILESLEEEEAIISYDQLIKVSDKIYEENDLNEYLDETDYPITIEELRKKFQQEMTEVKNDNNEISQVQLQEVVDKKEIEKFANSKENRFHTTPIISPVYGIQDENTELLTDSSDELDEEKENIF